MLMAKVKCTVGIRIDSMKYKYCCLRIFKVKFTNFSIYIYIYTWLDTWFAVFFFIKLSWKTKLCWRKKYFVLIKVKMIIFFINTWKTMSVCHVYSQTCLSWSLMRAKYVDDHWWYVVPMYNVSYNRIRGGCTWVFTCLSCYDF
jgi:hypothetical protein